ncbi:HAD family hydrolase [Oecophyllibacter saccharovorans]|uniref:HAD family hydrolase n=1 Tax=Oecophyllibacter saccharovorans TaxID=2558360 RepID=UPI001174A7C5|nr:HAD family hydrolase [Oecophyllibacter saccharovorans]TPW36620.1 HAD family hydrolase [Oecophyllibacter saccharovorans]
MSRTLPILLLDYDGTLAETRPAICRAIREGLLTMGLPPLAPGVLEDHLGRGATLAQFYKGLVPGATPEAIAAFEAAYRAHYKQADAEDTVLFPGVARTLETLRKRGYLMIALSNKHEGTLLEGIDRLGLKPYLAAALGAVPGLPRKPEAAVWTERMQPVLARLGRGEAQPSEALLVGDTTADLGFGQAVGMPVAWASYGHGTPDSCTPYQPQFQINSFPELLDHLPKPV